jgi:hypothetical protein
MALYVDARLITSSRAQSGRILYPASGTFAIGSYVDSSKAVAYTLNGLLDDVAVWSDSMGPQAVVMMYAAHRNTTVFVCPTCPPGTVSTDKCQGDLTVDCRPVYACPNCQAGERMSAPCKAPGILVPVTCVPCSTSCARGQRIVASSLCTGSGWADTECVNCKESCGEGHYITSTCINGTGFLDTGCTPCHACPSGQYISSDCGGSTKTDTRKCSNCTTSCDAGEVLVGSCDGSQYEDVVQCTACPLTTYSPGRNATACLDCPEGFYSDVSGASACKHCPAGTYSEPGSTACMQCSGWPCEDGYWRSVCTGRSSGTCAPMPTWTQLSVAGTSLPPLTKHGMTALPNGAAYIFGGRVAPRNTRTDAMYRVEFGTSSVPSVALVTPAAGTVAPSARDSHAMTSMGYDIIVAGGLAGSASAGTYMDDLWVLPQPAGNWSRRVLANLPVRMAGHKMAGTPDGLLWLFGGQGASGQALGKLYFINMRNTTRTWLEYTVQARGLMSAGANATSPAPQPRWDFGMVSQGYCIFVSCLDCCCPARMLELARMFASIHVIHACIFMHTPMYVCVCIFICINT